MLRTPSFLLSFPKMTTECSFAQGYSHWSIESVTATSQSTPNQTGLCNKTWPNSVPLKLFHDESTFIRRSLSLVIDSSIFHCRFKIINKVPKLTTKAGKTSETYQQEGHQEIHKNTSSHISLIVSYVSVLELNVTEIIIMKSAISNLDENSHEFTPKS